MTITATSLPIRAYGYPPVEWDTTIERWNVLPPDSLVEPVGGWGTLRIEVGAVWTVTDGVVTRDSAGTDWTTYRGCPTQVEALSWAEPYGEATGSLNIPALTVFDDLSQFSLKAVDIYRVLPPRLAAIYDRPEVPYWHGFIQSAEFGDGQGNRPGVRFQLYGAMFGEISLRAHQPLMIPDLQDVGTWLGRALDPQAYARPLAPFHFQFDSDTTGIELRHRGSRGQMVVDYCDEVLALAQEGSSQWTIGRSFDTDGFPIARVYNLRAKSNELAGAIQQNYVSAGGFGVALSLSVDPSQVPNRYFGEGVAPSGERWRNAVFPLLTETAPFYPSHFPVNSSAGNNTDADFDDDVVTALQAQLRASSWPNVAVTGTFDDDTVTALNALYEDQGHAQDGEISNSDDWDLVWSTGTGDWANLKSAWFKALAAKTEVDPFTYAADGDVTGANDDLDPAAIIVDQQVSFPEGTRKSRARKWSRRMVNQASAYPVMGTVTLTSDPTNEGADARSRLDVIEGSWTRVNNAGSPDGQYLDVYAAGVEVAPEAYAAPVTLTVASKSWDLLDVATRIARATEVKADPGKTMSINRRPQRPWRSASGWDAESGAGLLREFNHGGGWVVKPFIAGGFAGTIATLDLLVKPAQEYVFAVFATPVDAGDLTTYFPDPLAEEPDGYGWWTHPDTLDMLDGWGFIDAWGSFDLPAGYWPGLNKDDFPLTGKVKDAAGWPFSIDLEYAPRLWGAWYVPSSGSSCRGNLKIVIDEG